MAKNKMELDAKMPLRLRADERLLSKYKRGCGDCVYAMPHPRWFVPDYMAIRELTQSALVSYTIEAVDGSDVRTLAVPQVRLWNDYDYIFKHDLIDNGDGTFASLSLSTLLPLCKEYCIKIVDVDGNSWVSEPFMPTESSVISTIDLISNGNFDSDLAGWTPIGFVWSGGVAHRDATQLTSKMTQAVNVASTTFFQLSFDMSNNAGLNDTEAVQIIVDNVLLETVTTGDGWKSAGFLLTSGNHTIEIRTIQSFTSTWTVDIDNVKLSPYSVGLCGSHWLEWQSDCTVGIAIGKAETSIVNRFYFGSEVEIGEPIYKMSIETVDNGISSLDTLIKKTKTYRMEIGLLPEYAVDAIVEMRLFKDTKIFYRYNLGYDELQDVKVIVEWPFHESCYANVTIEFDVDDGVSKLNCCDDFDEGCAGLCDTVDGILDVSIHTPIEDNSYVKGFVGAPIVYHASGAIEYVDCTGTVNNRGVLIYTAKENGTFGLFDVLSAFTFDNNLWKPAFYLDNAYPAGDPCSVSTEGAWRLLGRNGWQDYLTYELFGSTDGIDFNSLGVFSKAAALEGIPVDLSATEYWLYWSAQRGNYCDTRWSAMYRCNLYALFDAPTAETIEGLFYCNVTAESGGAAANDKIALDAYWLSAHPDWNVIVEPSVNGAACRMWFPTDQGIKSLYADNLGWIDLETFWYTTYQYSVYN